MNKTREREEVYDSPLGTIAIVEVTLLTWSNIGP